MKISDLKKDYPQIRFYELIEYPRTNIPLIKRMEDFLELTKIVGYKEFETSKEEASEIYLNIAVDLYLKISPNEKYLSFNYPEKDSFMEFINENFTKSLKKLITCESYTTLSLYGIDISVGFEEDYPYANANFDDILAELDNLHKRYEQKLSDMKEEWNTKIISCIMSYKEKYLNSTTKSEQDEIIRRVQLELKDKFGLDSRSDSRAKKIFIKTQYEIN